MIWPNLWQHSQVFTQIKWFDHNLTRTQLDDDYDDADDDDDAADDDGGGGGDDDYDDMYNKFQVTCVGSQRMDISSASVELPPTRNAFLQISLYICYSRYHT